MKARNLAALLLVALAFLSVPATAAPAPSPVGTELRINTDTNGFHSNPSVAAFQDGSFVVTWSGNGVRARFLDNNGRPTSGEIPLGMGSVAATVHQVVADRDGTFLVVATGFTTELPFYNIYVRRFYRNGTPKGKVIRANDARSAIRDRPVATIGPDGRFAVGWRELVPWSGPGGDYTNAVARIFSAKGKPLTPEILLREGDPASPAGDDLTNAITNSLALAPDGTLSALVQANGSVCLQSSLVRVAPNGRSSSSQFLGGPFCANPILTDASLAMGRDGSLVAAWTHFDAQAQRFAPNGTPRGEAFAVSEEPVDYQIDPAVALQAGGSFVVVWTDTRDRDGEGKGIFGRSFAPNGTPRTDDFLVNTTTAGDQQEAAIAAPRRGNVLVVWVQRSEERSGIFARLLSANQ